MENGLGTRSIHSAILLNVNQLVLCQYEPVLEPTAKELHRKTINIKLLNGYSSISYQTRTD